MVGLFACPSVSGDPPRGRLLWRAGALTHATGQESDRRERYAAWSRSHKTFAQTRFQTTSQGNCRRSAFLQFSPKNEIGRRVVTCVPEVLKRSTKQASRLTSGCRLTSDEHHRMA